MELDETYNNKADQLEDAVFFAPIEVIRDIERVLNKLEITRKELQKVADGMKPVVES